jgi:hypothetical protein
VTCGDILLVFDDFAVPIFLVFAVSVSDLFCSKTLKIKSATNLVINVYQVAISNLQSLPMPKLWVGNIQYLKGPKQKKSNNQVFN